MTIPTMEPGPSFFAATFLLVGAEVEGAEVEGTEVGIDEG